MQKLANLFAATLWIICTAVALVLCFIFHPIIWLFEAAQKAEWIDPYDKGYDRAELGTTAGIVELVLVLIFACVFIGTVLMFAGL